jgi:hypothetical protein
MLAFDKRWLTPCVHDEPRHLGRSITLGWPAGSGSASASLPACLGEHLLEQLARQRKSSEWPVLVRAQQAVLAAVRDEPRFCPRVGHALAGLPAQDGLAAYAKLGRPPRLGYAARLAQRPQYRVPGRARGISLGQPQAVTRSHAEHLAVSRRELARVRERLWWRRARQEQQRPASYTRAKQSKNWGYPSCPRSDPGHPGYRRWALRCAPSSGQTYGAPGGCGGV